MNSPLKLLYIDDEPDIRYIVEVVLEDEPDFEIVLCASGQEGLTTALEFCPDIILLDVMMPVWDGPMTLKAMRQEKSLLDIPIIFITAKVRKHEIAEFKSLGAIDVIAKPFDPMKLADQIRFVYQEWINAPTR